MQKVTNHEGTVTQMSLTRQYTRSGSRTIHDGSPYLVRRLTNFFRFYLMRILKNRIDLFFSVYRLAILKHIKTFVPTKKMLRFIKTNLSRKKVDRIFSFILIMLCSL